MQYFIAICLVLSSFFWLQVFASDTPIQLKLTVFKEVQSQNKQGKTITKLITPTNVTPNDTVIYIAEFQNNSNQAARHVRITVPIPKHLIYLSNSATKHFVSARVPVRFSVDHGKRFDIAKRLTVIDSTGKKYPANPEDYTHIRWVIPSIVAGNTGSVQFKAKLK